MTGTLNDLKVAELKQMASEKKIDLTGKTVKAEIVEAIEAFEKPRYIFDRKRCPRCGGPTRATSTQGRIQYRICKAPICRRRFNVRGRPEKEPEPMVEGTGEEGIVKGEG